MLATFLIMLGLLILVLIFLIPRVQVRKVERNAETKGPLELENDYRQTLVQIFGGIALLATVYVAFDNARVAHDSIVQATRTYELARRAQISDRTLKALEMLSKETNMDAKVGAMHILEQVAIEDPKSEWLVTETLADYLRLHSEWNARSPRNAQEAPPDVGVVFVFLRRRPWKTNENGKEICVEYHQCLDYQKNQQPSESDADFLKMINLPNVDLRHAYLDNVMFKKAILNQAHLENARFRYAHCENVYAEDSYFNGADLRDSYWNLANLRNAHLQGARLQNAHLENAFAEGSNLSGADLTDSYWTGGNLKGAHLDRAQLARAHVEKVYAEHSSFSHAELGFSNWNSANLKNADLTCSHWQQADMKDAFLEGAKLFGADLGRAVNLTKEQLEKAQGDSMTKLSDKALRPDNWSRKPEAACVNNDRPGPP